MDVIVDCYGDLKPFLLKVGRFDTVGKIKEKIEQLQGIPIFKQTICFNNEILPNDFYRYARDFGIADGSALLLLPAGHGTNAEFNLPLPADNEDPHFLDNLLSPLLLESPSDSGAYLDGYPIKSPAGKYFQCEGGTPGNSNTPNGVTPQGDSNIPNGVTPQGNSNIPNRLRVFPRRFTQRRPPSMRVVVRYNDQQTTVPVHRDEPVLVLRGRARQRGLRLPDSCFFVHRQRVMQEGHSFARNQVHHGDLIEPFPAHVLTAAPDSESVIHTASRPVSGSGSGSGDRSD